MSAGPAIVCRGLRKTYGGGVDAVRGLDLEVAGGECFGLLGPNGAGKTTTIEILEGLLEPTAGEVRILGRGWRRDARELRQRLGVSLQETRLSEKLSVRETLRLFAGFYRHPRSVDAVLDELELREKADAWVGKLSGGQRQRLAVATALMGDPELLFLDEPTTGLDPHSRRQLWDLIAAFRLRGGTVLLTTHYMEEAERLCDRVAIIDHGRVIALGSPAELIQRMGGNHVVEFALAAGLAPTDAELLQLPGVSAVHRHDGRIALTVREAHAAVPALLGFVAGHAGVLVHLSTHQASLEDVFMQLAGRTLGQDGAEDPDA